MRSFTVIARYISQLKDPYRHNQQDSIELYTYCGKTWGPKPHNMKWIHTQTIIPAKSTKFSTITNNRSIQYNSHGLPRSNKRILSSRFSHKASYTSLRLRTNTWTPGFSEGKYHPISMLFTSHPGQSYHLYTYTTP